MEFRHAELVSASIFPHLDQVAGVQWTLKQVQGDEVAIEGMLA
jgi:hypothetical protein